MKKTITVFMFLLMLQQLSFAVVRIENEAPKQEKDAPIKKRITIRDIFKLKKRIKKVKRKQLKRDGLSPWTIVLLIGAFFMALVILALVYSLFWLLILLALILVVSIFVFVTEAANDLSSHTNK